MITHSQSLLALKNRIFNLTLRDAISINNRGHINARDTQYTKYHMYIQQRGKCCFCERMMYADSDHCPIRGKLATIEHVIPKSKGGSNHLSNYKLSCHACNNDRKVMDFDHYKNSKLWLIRNEDAKKAFKAKVFEMSKAKRRLLKAAQLRLERVERFLTNEIYRSKVIAAFPKTNIEDFLKNYDETCLQYVPV